MEKIAKNQRHQIQNWRDLGYTPVEVIP